MLTIELKADAKFQNVLQTRSNMIVKMLAAKMNALMFLLSSRIVSQKLSGQMLKVKTGVLRASVHPVPTLVQGTTIKGAVESSAPPATYGRIHEFGRESAYEIVANRAKALSFVMDGRRIFAKSVTHPEIPAKPFMQSALDEMEGQIRQSLQETLDKTIRK